MVNPLELAVIWTTSTPLVYGAGKPDRLTLAIQVTFPVHLREGWRELAAGCPRVVVQPPGRREDILKERHLCYWGERGPRN